MTVYYLVLPTAMPPDGLLHLLGPLCALAQPAQTGLFPTPCVSTFSYVASTTIPSAYDVSTCTACRPCRAPKRVCGPPAFAPSPIGD